MEHKRLPRTDWSQVQAKGIAEKPKRAGRRYVKSFRCQNEHYIIAVLRQQRYGVQLVRQMASTGAITLIKIWQEAHALSCDPCHRGRVTRLRESC